MTLRPVELAAFAASAFFSGLAPCCGAILTRANSFATILSLVNQSTFRPVDAAEGRLQSSHSRVGNAVARGERSRHIGRMR